MAPNVVSLSELPDGGISLMGDTDLALLEGPAPLAAPEALADAWLLGGVAAVDLVDEDHWREATVFSASRVDLLG